MDFGSCFYVTQEEFNLFHRMDRELYKILVVSLFRDPEESMQVHAMWLWLERVGFRNVVKRVLALPNILINDVADETVMCLNCINNSLLMSCLFSSESSEIPLLQSLVEKEISLQFVYENRSSALQGVAKVMQDVCVRAFTDIMEQAMIRNSAEAAAQKVVTTTRQSSSSSSSSENYNYHHGLVWFGSIGPAEDRTLFVTFSKGYRVEEWEVREFFALAYGDCIEALFMQEVQPNEQALFARIVFRAVSTIDMILRGANKAKFIINGKHVWARKFVPKRNATRTTLLATTL
ncbi:hypothetical protein AAZX31_13G093300 [Glycine max]|uniref:Uncharacterized protein n=1 Tax=Glycine soja TaxID=3848 RepID=A0A0B2PJJ2_GLYSO|nr:uncharacterized protein LOC114380929 [Glycine soja]KAG4970238.1 hypothetical protein JHK85_036659 [Glycine max]KHN07899.1 hypothetical protein glysoja_032443 [Glycine soja]RZB71935.1 hypothetical protein D0Y65_036355 [Glycine soja]